MEGILLTKFYQEVQDQTLKSSPEIQLKNLQIYRFYELAKTLFVKISDEQYQNLFDSSPKSQYKVIVDMFAENQINKEDTNPSKIENDKIFKWLLTQQHNGCKVEEGARQKKSINTQSRINRLVFLWRKIVEEKSLSTIDLANLLKNELEKKFPYKVDRKTILKLLKDLERLGLIKIHKFKVSVELQNSVKRGSELTRVIASNAFLELEEKDVKNDPSLVNPFFNRSKQLPHTLSFLQKRITRSALTTRRGTALKRRESQKSRSKVFQRPKKLNLYKLNNNPTTDDDIDISNDDLDDEDEDFSPKNSFSSQEDIEVSINRKPQQTPESPTINLGSTNKGSSGILNGMSLSKDHLDLIKKISKMVKRIEFFHKKYIYKRLKGNQLDKQISIKVLEGENKKSKVIEKMNHYFGTQNVVFKDCVEFQNSFLGKRLPFESNEDEEYILQDEAFINFLTEEEPQNISQIAPISFGSTYFRSEENHLISQKRIKNKVNKKLKKIEKSSIFTEQAANINLKSQSSAAIQESDIQTEKDTKIDNMVVATLLADGTLEQTILLDDSTHNSFIYSFQ